MEGGWNDLTLQFNRLEQVNDVEVTVIETCGSCSYRLLLSCPSWSFAQEVLMPRCLFISNMDSNGHRYLAKHHISINLTGDIQSISVGHFLWNDMRKCHVGIETLIYKFIKNKNGQCVHCYVSENIIFLTVISWMVINTYCELSQILFI